MLCMYVICMYVCAHMHVVIPYLFDKHEVLYIISIYKNIGTNISYEEAYNMNIYFCYIKVFLNTLGQIYYNIMYSMCMLLTHSGRRHFMSANYPLFTM
jgi:hypothetical protein